MALKDGDDDWGEDGGGDGGGGGGSGGGGGGGGGDGDGGDGDGGGDDGCSWAPSPASLDASPAWQRAGESLALDSRAVRRFIVSSAVLQFLQFLQFA